MEEGGLKFRKAEPFCFQAVMNHKALNAEVTIWTGQDERSSTALRRGATPSP